MLFPTVGELPRMGHGIVSTIGQRRARETPQQRKHDRQKNDGFTITTLHKLKTSKCELIGAHGLSQSFMMDNFPPLAAAQPQRLQHSICTVESYDLTVADIFHHCKCHQDHHMLQLRVAPQGDLFQHHRSHGKQSAISHRQQKEQEKNLQRRAQQKETDGNQDNRSKGLHHAPANLDKEMEWHAEHARSSISAVEDHVPISPESLGHAKLPAAPLAGKHAQTPWRLSPANRVRSKNDAELASFLGQVTADGSNDVDVFRYRIVAETTGADYGIFVQNTKRA